MSEFGQSSPPLIGRIRALASSEANDRRHDATAARVSAAICELLAELLLVNDTEDEKLGDWEDAIREARCKMIGSCEWDFDQCGYWGHQYCLSCNKSKYPEIGRLSCAEAIKKIGRITEEEYLKRTTTPPPPVESGPPVPDV